MDTPTKDEVKSWLRKNGKDRDWLAEKLNTKKSVVDSWFSTRGFPDDRLLDIFNLMQDRKMEESMIRIPFDDDMLKLANKAANIVSSDFLDFCVGAIRHHEEKVIEDESGEELNQGNGLPKAS